MLNDIKIMLGDAASNYTDERIGLAYKSALAEVDGRAVTEEIVSRIFSHFCVGK